jgi:hypothetical protein
MSLRRLALAYAFTLTVAFLVGLAYALTIPPTYTTDALLIGKEQNNSSMSTLASATKLLGMGGGADQNSNFSKFQKYWGSRDVAEQILRKNPDLLRRMFRRDWDTTNNRWYEGPHTFQQWLAIPLNEIFGVNPGYKPTAEDLAAIIKTTMKPEIDDVSGEMFIQYKSADAAFARWFLNTVISETDQAVRAAEQRRDEDFITFSHNRLERETNVGYRDALTDLVRQFEINIMYSAAGNNFSFQYVEVPYLPTVHSAPRPLLYTVIVFIIANVLAACVVGAMILWPTSGFSRRMDKIVGWIDRRPLPRAELQGPSVGRRVI